METCKICGRTFKGTNPLCVHLRRAHNIDAKTYYDYFYKKDNEGYCLYCGKHTLFNSLVKGYNLYCSTFCANNSPKRIEKIKHTMIDKYGVSNIFQLESVREHCEKAANSTEAREKAKQTCIEHFGVDNPLKSSQIQEKSKQTCIERYGVKYSFQSNEVRNKSKETMLEKYGVTHNSQLDKNKAKFVTSTHTKEADSKRYTTRKTTGWHKNKVENYFIEKLNGIQYKQNYKSTIYPYRCDFYFPEFDLYIEINNYWAHGQHFHDSNNKQDKELLQKWKDRTKQSKDQYGQAIKTWLRDLDKKECALKNNLNYVVLWNYEQIDRFFELFQEHAFIGFVDFNEL